MKVLQLLLAMFLVSATTPDDKTDRRGFLRKVKDAYLQGRYSREEKRIVERKEAEKLRRRAVFERNVKSLVDGAAARLKRGPRQVTLVIIGGTALVVFLCLRNSIGCERKEQ